MDEGDERGARVRLVLLSFLMLFVELALIRWTGSNVVYLSYFSNFVLLGSFLGIGIGFLRARAKTNLFPWAPVALAALVVFVRRYPVRIDRRGTELLFFGEFTETGLPIWATLPILFVFVAVVMATVGEGVARTFARFPPLEGYRLDILGSILGIAGFSLLSFTHAPPIVWGAAVALLFTGLLATKVKPIQMAAGLLAIVAMLGTLAQESSTPGSHWSPYYRIDVEQTHPDFALIHVNGIPHQVVEPTTARRAVEPFYFLPYEHRADPRYPADVLIVGAGTGSDVAIALSYGAQRVDAVEIDPGLQRLGEELHPDRPYDDPRVNVIIDDGRAFLEQTGKKYNLILFALPDSLTLVAGQSSLRLESYLFTLEAMHSARDHLAPEGVFAMYNYYRETWLIDRLAGTLNQAFGHPPCIDVITGFAGVAVMQASVEPTALECPTRWSAPEGGAIAPARDDYPFLYLPKKELPTFYLEAILLILAASAIGVRLAAGPLAPMKGYADLFFMGAAFLLLETKNVVQFALLFGTTWFVNALVFGGVLLSVLAAVEVARRTRLPRPVVLYAALGLALVVAWIVPTRALLELQAVPRFFIATALAFAPIFLANLVFAERFRRVGNSPAAFGANLLGAMVGGVLEYGALIVGYRSLLILAALLYGAAFLFTRGALPAATDAAVPSGAMPGPVGGPEKA